jgi:hypothetical protein
VGFSMLAHTTQGFTRHHFILSLLMVCFQDIFFMPRNNNAFDHRQIDIWIFDSSDKAKMRVNDINVITESLKCTRVK